MQLRGISRSHLVPGAVATACFTITLFVGINTFAATSPPSSAVSGLSSQPQAGGLSLEVSVKDCMASVAKDPTGHADRAALDDCMRDKGFTPPAEIAVKACKASAGSSDRKTLERCLKGKGVSSSAIAGSNETAAVRACMASVSKGPPGSLDQTAMDECMKGKGYTPPVETALKACQASVGVSDQKALEKCVRAKGFTLPKSSVNPETAAVRECISSVAKDPTNRPDRAAMDECLKGKGITPPNK